MSNSDERTRYRFECECNGEIPMDELTTSEDLGDALRKAGYPGNRIKRCIRYMGVWYVKT